MISTHLTGNFGDHIVRYALCRTVAEKNGFVWSINRKPSFDYYRGQEQLNFFDLDYGIPNTAPYGVLPEGITNEWKENVIHHQGYDFYEFQPEIFSISDNTHLTIFCGQDARYYEKEKLLKWYTVKPELINLFEEQLYSLQIILDENLTVINIRGGEYKGIPDLILGTSYWWTAISYMKTNNPFMRFIVVTDDIEYSSRIMPPDMNIPVIHLSIGGDYYILNNAKNLIISNSGFALFPVWLNKNKPNVIAPLHWARHNKGYWANSCIWTFGKDNNWKWLDREGNLLDYHESMRI